MPVDSRLMRYQVRERLFSIKDDFWVTDQDGNRAFFVDAVSPFRAFSKGRGIM